ncbi:MAG: hypothetical protein NWQ38_01705 [Cellulophaga sp.]|nr:hypothetical protein [Cellulophaga sp.]
MKKIIIVFSFLFFTTTSVLIAQGNTEYTGGYKVNLNEDGSKYFRTIIWGQFWGEYSDNVPEESSKFNLSIRRARMLTYLQLNKKFMVLTHFGLNSLNGDNMSPTGKGESSQLFFHDFWGEWSLDKKHSIGAGMHYWNGISRLNSASTLNFMTLDNNRQSWAVLGLSDQFARHIGIYMKGRLGKLSYNISIDEAITNNLQSGVTPEPNGAAIYAGRRLLGSRTAGKLAQGYFSYGFLEQESNFLPYKVGTYLGSKKIFNIGAGFLVHPNGSVISDATGNLTGEDVSIFAADVFYDTPLGEDGSAVTAYAVYQNNDYGRNFTLGSTYDSGAMLYGQVGYLLPGTSKNTRIQPYLSYQNRSINAIDDNANRLGIGGNLYFTGHHSKLSVEYTNAKYGTNENIGSLTLQAMIYL